MSVLSWFRRTACGWRRRSGLRAGRQRLAGNPVTGAAHDPGAGVQPVRVGWLVRQLPGRTWHRRANGNGNPVAVGGDAGAGVLNAVGAPARLGRRAAAQCHQAPFVYEMKGA